MKLLHILPLLPLLGAASALLGSFTLLTTNVAGLPAILNSNDVPGDKTTNAKLIGSLFSQYNYSLIHVQEDFNYHAALYSTDTHPYRTPTSGGVPFGSGLNTLSNYPWIDFRRVKWDTCSSASGADCLTPKGFTFMRAVLEGGGSVAVYVDVYNLHTDAGGEEKDLVARQANVRQVGEYIKTWSKGNAVLVFGDTNSRYSRAADAGIRELLDAKGAGLSDPWLMLARGIREPPMPMEESLCGNPSGTNWCETVDKIFFRSSPLVELMPTAHEYVGGRFLQPNGDILSDHNPVLVNFTYVTGRELQQSNLHGGPHGNWFSDGPVLAGRPGPIRVESITFQGGARVDGVSVILADGTVLKHGGEGGSASSLALKEGEYWTEGEMCQAQKDKRTRIFYIKAKTSAAREVQSGTRTGECVVYRAPDGWQIVGFLGQDGNEIDQLGFLYAKR